MKNQSLSKHHQSLRKLSDTYIFKVQKPEEDISNASDSPSPTTENYDDNLDHQKSFFMWSREELTGKDYITYLYGPGNIYYECSLDSNRARKEIFDFLKSQNIDIEQGVNILENIKDQEAFHRDFLEHFSHDDPIFNITSGDSSSEYSDSSSNEDIESIKDQEAFHRNFLERFSHGDPIFSITSGDDSSEYNDSSSDEDNEGCEELDSPDYNNDFSSDDSGSENGSDLSKSDSDREIEIIRLSEFYQGIEE